MRPAFCASIRSFDIGGLGLGEILGAVDQGDDIALGGVFRQAPRIFDAGIAAADHENMFVDIFRADRLADTAHGASLAPSQRIRLGLPWVPMARMTASALIASPLVRVMVKSPFLPVTDFTSAL